VPNSPITRLRTRTQPLAEIVDSYFDGLFSACAGSLQTHVTPAAANLYVRTLVRLGRPADAIDAIALVIAASPNATHAELGELMMHRAAALARMRRDDDAEMQLTLSNARAYVYSAMSPALEAELTFVEALVFAMGGDVDAAAPVARSVLDFTADGELEYVVPLAHTRARALDLLAFIAARREDDGARRDLLRAALDACDGSARRDIAFEANVLANLAIYAREFGDDGSVRARFERMPDVEQLRSQRYEILRSLAWSNALVGNNLGTFRDLRDASETAPTTATKIRAIVDRAYFASELGQGLIAREEIDFAVRLSERVDWSAVAHQERELDALLSLGVALIPVDVERARNVYERYRKLKPKLSPESLATIDRRARAEEITAEAKISSADGDERRAVSLFLEAFETWDARGYRVRAALVARELSALGAGERFAAYVAEEAARLPKSWLARVV
jgi:hypothetical protein